MVEGFDREVRLTSSSRLAVDRALRILRMHWPNGVVRFEEGSQVTTPLGSLALPAPEASSIFVDASQEIAGRIEKEGVVPEVASQTLWMFLRDGYLCFALDREGSELDSVVGDIIRAVSPLECIRQLKAAA